jgi:hypothetical protein
MLNHRLLIAASAGAVTFMTCLMVASMVVFSQFFPRTPSIAVVFVLPLVVSYLVAFIASEELGGPAKSWSSHVVGLGGLGGLMAAHFVFSRVTEGRVSDDIPLALFMLFAFVYSAFPALGVLAGTLIRVERSARLQ